MAKKSLNMNGPYDLTEETVKKTVPEDVFGNYALGYTDNEDIFRVQYVGRCIREDGGLADRLIEHIRKDKPGHKQFKYSVVDLDEDAINEECRNYHDFGEKESLENEDHPPLPKGVKCKYCDHVGE